MTSLSQPGIHTETLSQKTKGLVVASLAAMTPGGQGSPGTTTAEHQHLLGKWWALGRQTMWQ